MNSLRFVSKTAVRLNTRKALQVLGGTLVVLLLSFQHSRQGSAGRIVGAIIDSNGGVIARRNGDYPRRAKRNKPDSDIGRSGSYNAPNLIPGSYKVRAEFRGLGHRSQNIVLEVGQENSR